jgi:hypothetical protein
MCGACIASRLPALAEEETSSEAQQVLTPAKLNYCGYSCPPDCKFLKGTLEDNIELRKEAFKLWKIEERFGVEFDPEQAICYGCKAPGKPEGIVLQRCDVRACVQKKKLDCCIECPELEACDKDLWRRFPKFKQKVIQMQQQYRSQG